jgi:hypothetical protein
MSRWPTVETFVQYRGVGIRAVGEWRTPLNIVFGVFEQAIIYHVSRSKSQFDL